MIRRNLYMLNVFGVPLFSLLAYPLYFFAFYPWAVIYHHIDQRQKNKAGPSNLWIAVMILIPIVGATFYVFKHVNQKVHLWLSRLAIASICIFVGALGATVVTYKSIYLASFQAEVKGIKVSISKSKNTGGLFADEFKKLYGDLDSMAEALNTNPILDRGTIENSQNLMVLMKTYLSDNSLSRAEFLNWKALYAASKNVDPVKIKYYVSETRSGREPASVPRR